MYKFLLTYRHQFYLYIGLIFLMLEVNIIDLPNYIELLSTDFESLYLLFAVALFITIETEWNIGVSELLIGGNEASDYTIIGLLLILAYFFR